jgi:AcrR family transcriptional regulator
MPPDDNSVNIKNAPRGYHHGDLRDALIEAGMRLLEQRHAGDLGLREVARAVGVSPTAVYRHFPDKDALLQAVAARGFAMMGAMQGRAAEGCVGADAFRAAGVAYVRFALANPAVFRLMFSSARPRDVLSLPTDTESEPLRILRANAAGLTPPGAPEEVPRVIAVQAWALVHGLAMLMLDNMVPADEGLIEAVVAAAWVGSGSAKCR